MLTLSRIVADLWGLCSVFTLGWSLSAATQVPCPVIVDFHLRVFEKEKMGIEDAAKNLLRSCTGKVEVVSIDYKPNFGFVQSFEGGDIYTEVDSFVLIQCRDGHAMVKTPRKRNLSAIRCSRLAN